MKNFSASRLWVATVIVVLAAGLVIGNDAMAWGKKKDDGPKDPKGKAVNLNLMPEMVITRGVLQRDAFGQWALDGKTLAFDKNSRIGENDAQGGEELIAGREAMVIGAPLGENLLVHRVVLISATESSERGLLYPTVVNAAPDPLPGATPQ